jgi:hypothetical protein
MSDHPDVPRVSFIDEHYKHGSFDIEWAVAEFRDRLIQKAKEVPNGTVRFTLTIEMRACDCEESITGRDEGCPLHGDPEVIRS